MILHWFVLKRRFEGREKGEKNLGGVFVNISSYRYRVMMFFYFFAVGGTVLLARSVMYLNRLELLGARID